MSSFQVNITPPQPNTGNKQNEAREPILVTMAPFSAKSIVSFEDVPVTKTAKRILKIYNPSDSEIEVVVNKKLRPELNVTLQWTSNVVPAESEISMEIVWNPLQEIVGKEIIQIIDNRNYKKDVSLIFKTLKKPKAGVKRFPTVTTGTLKNLKLKSPKSNISKLKLLQPKKDDPKLATRTTVNPVIRSSSQNNTIQLIEEKSVEINTKQIYLPSEKEINIKNKENVSPMPTIMVNKTLYFTPEQKESNNMDYLASLPTPVGKSTNHLSGRLINYSPEDMSKTITTQSSQETNSSNQLYLKSKHLITVVEENDCNQMMSSTFQRITPELTFIQEKNCLEKIEISKDVNNLLTINNKTFDVKSDFLNNSDSQLSIEKDNIYQEQVYSNSGSRLACIEEEAVSPTNQMKKPTDNLKRDVQLVGTPLRKHSESMKNLSLMKSPQIPFAIQGSMPNLNDMEAIQSIEKNRYYYDNHVQNSNDFYESNVNISDTSISSTKSNDFIFNQHEILAASSRYNLHEECQISDTNKRQKSTVQNSNYKRRREEESPKQLLNIPKSNIIQISPPKRSKIEELPLIGTTMFRTPKLSNVQQNQNKKIQKMSTARKPITPRKMKIEPRQFLYNSDTFLLPYINPDPFAATTTEDPFLTRNMYFDQCYVEKYEKQFTKWLNALVSIPSELRSDDEQNIDVGKLFSEVRNKQLILAPTKEEHSMNYLTKFRMESLRGAAVRLFMSEEMRIPCSNIAVYIKKAGISMRSDRHLHLDVVMQRNILELLLSFNPLWLRIGLEVVFGEIIHLHSNSDVVGLSTFILNRLFRDKFLEEKYSRAYALSDEYNNHIKEFTLQKILFLLLFLDKAKMKNIIKHNPCLFVKTSNFKETKQILLKFSSELLASVGDVTKDLRRFGYVLLHKQTFMDEFNYAFKNLAVDLRDGIRLVRVVEIILLRNDLISQVRCPAISRLQRIYNVNLALKALANAGFELKGDIHAHEIVDGYREKTFSLLWQIIYKFRAPKFIAAANVIQKWWRKNWLKVLIMRKIKLKIELKRNRAAIKIQTAFRGYIARKYTKILQWQRTQAVLCLQKYCRRFLAKRKVIIAISSVILIQRWYRQWKIVRQCRKKFIEMQQSALIIQFWYRRVVLTRKLEKIIPIIREIKAVAKLKHEKSLILQRVLRSYVIRKKLRSIVNGFIQYNRKRKLEYHSASKIQSFFQQIKLRRSFLNKRNAVIKIKNYWRSYKAMRVARAQFLGRREAAIAIQQYYRSYAATKIIKNYYLTLKIQTIVIQNRFRANKLCQIQKKTYEELRCNVIKIQKKFRAKELMKKDLNYYSNVRKSVIFIQQRWRAKLEMRSQRHKYLMLRNSAILIQRKFLALTQMKKQRNKYVSMKTSAIVIQQQFRAFVAMRTNRIYYLNLIKYVIFIQQHYRGLRLVKSNFVQYNQMKKATLFIQQRYRALREMRTHRSKFINLRTNVVFIQRKWKATLLMRQTRIKYLELQYNTILVQQRYRANKLMHKERGSYVQKRKATIVLQCHLRGWLEMNYARNEYSKLKKATLCIQQRFRAQKAMNKARTKYLKLREVVSQVQKRRRSLMIMRNDYRSFVLLKKCVIFIQRKFKANFEMKKCRQSFLDLKHYSITIQQRWRAQQEMRKLCSNYLQLKKSTLYIQQKLRAKWAMKIQRKEYLTLKLVTVRIQRYYRATINMREQCNQFRLLKEYTIKIQQLYRAKISMIKNRNYYNDLRTKTIFVQQTYRAKQAMNLMRTQYLLKKESCIKIQTYVRSHLLMKREQYKFLQLKQAVLKIQKWYRAILIMRTTKAEYELKIKSILKIQSFYRAQQKRYEFVQLKKAVTNIQQRFRANLIMQIERKKYLILREKVILIQRKFRANHLRRILRNQYLLIRSLVISIQQRYRAKLKMRDDRHNFLLIKNAVITIESKYLAKLKMKQDRELYLRLKMTALGMQSFSRGYLARRNFNEKMTPEMRILLRKKRAARIIQRVWRGYRIRNTWKNNLKLMMIRERLCGMKKNDSKSSVKFKITSYIKFLKGRFHVQEALSVLMKLENLSRSVPTLLMGHSAFISSFCYGIMAQAIRSEADKQIIELCSKIILNLARCKNSNANIFQENGLVTIAQMLLRWCDKDCDIFNTLCTLIFVFAECPQKKKKIRAFMIHRDAIFMLRETKKMVVRKDKMRQNTRKLNIPNKSNSLSFPQRTLPSLEPDYGIVRGKPYIFMNSVYAFEVILSKLEIRDVY